MSKTPIPIQPLNRIALTFSGGGYRAASFHLGAMDYFSRALFQGEPLLNKVKAISTVSGGTITGALYAVMLKEAYEAKRAAASKEGKDGAAFEFEFGFDGFFGRLHEFIGKDLVELALKRLNDDTRWEAHKRRNLINAFAQIYHEELVGGATFGLFEDLYGDGTHLEEVIFNATEFKHALFFRFQNQDLNDPNPGNQALCGNWYIWFNRAEKAEFRVGDIVAASSCFPSGFEPLAFPLDFMPKDASPHLTKLVEAANNAREVDEQIDDLNRKIDRLGGIIKEKKDEGELYCDEEKEKNEIFWQRKNLERIQQLADPWELEGQIETLERRIDVLSAVIRKKESNGEDFRQEEALKHKKERQKEDLERKKERSVGQIGLMDGGIVDNQGLDAIVDSEWRRRKKLKESLEGKACAHEKRELSEDDKAKLGEKQFDLLFISDVSSPYLKPAHFANPLPSERLQKWSAGKIGRTIGLLDKIFIGISVVFPIVLLIFVLSLSGEMEMPAWMPPSSGVLTGFLILPMSGYWFVRRWIKKELNEGKKEDPTYDPEKTYTLKDFVPEFYQQYLPDLTKLTFGTIKPMVEDRLNSVLSMVKDVFLKQVRRLTYEKVYQDRAWKHRLLSNFIYELRSDDLRKRRDRNPEKFYRVESQIGPASQALSTTAEIASSMGTTLWFTQEEKESCMIEYLIACGQFAACYNLLEYLSKLKDQPDYAELDDTYKQELETLWNQMLADWKRFNDAPFFMVFEKLEKLGKVEKLEKLRETLASNSIA